MRRRAAAILAALLVVPALSPAIATGRPVAATYLDFESDAVGTTPRACRTPEGRQPATVTDERARSGRHSLLVSDVSTSSQTVVVCPTGAMTGADVALQVFPEQLENGVLISLLGTFEGKDAVDATVFHVWVKPDGSLWWFDGLSQDALGWTQLGAAGSVDVGRWNDVVIQVPRDMGRALVYAGSGDGPRARPGRGAPRPRAADYVGAAGPVGVSPVASVTAVQVASAGTGTVGDVAYVDDIRFANGDRVSAPRPDRTFRVGDAVTVDQTSDGYMQMPNTAVTIPRRHGPDEVVVAYPVHGDATHDTGTALASSLDGGRTWTSADDRNPFPDEQSFYLSRLDDGSLLAVSYHTFMVEGSGETRAVVPTAVSRDGGRTWKHRDGEMTAPQRMRPISDATSRPGSRLGGFVLVHSVVETDGTLYQSGYGYYDGDTRYRQVVLASRDGGESWAVRGTVGVDPDLSDHPRYEGFSEAGIAESTDGGLLAVMRTGNYQPLYQSRSNDEGATWSEPEMVTAGPDDLPVAGVFPDLVRLPSGALVLWIGRPGQSLLASPDGNGGSWSTPHTVDYLNSGNGTLVPVGRDRLLTFGDRGADWTPNTPATKAVWARAVAVRAHR